HRHNNRIRAGERDEEMKLPQPLVHHPPEHLREPIIGGGENSEDRRHAHNQMEMANHKISIVQRNIQHRLSQERPAKSARYEQRNESDRKSHRRLQANASTPKSTEPVESLDSGRYPDGHRHNRKRKCRIRAHAAHEHVMSPYHEAEKADGHEGISHRLVSEDRLSGESRDQLRRNPHSRENRYV